MIDQRGEVVRIENLCKRYGKRGDYAVEGVSLTCREGEILGLLGHNGAGKSTTLKCLMGMLPFDAGEITVCGHSIEREPNEAKRNSGFVTDNHSVFVKMTGLQYVMFMADVYQVPTEHRRERLDKLEEVFRLGGAIHNLISSYSHGMKQKICMMGSLIHAPKLWILDEPMTGLDPRTMRAVSNFMREYAAQGNAIIFSSHDLNSVEKLCDRVVTIQRGKQVADIVLRDFIAQNPEFDLEEYFFRDEN